MNKLHTIKVTNARKVKGGKVFTMNIKQNRKPDIYKDGLTLAALRGEK